MKLADPLLETPQLGVAKRSPVTPVKNEKECAVVLEKLGRGHQSAGGIRQSELRSGLARTQSVLGRGDLSAPIEDEGDKEASDEEAERAKYRSANFTAVVPRIAKSPLEADGEQCSARQEQDVVCPGDIARAGKDGEDRNVAYDRPDDNQKADPDGEIKMTLHRPHLRIHKCRPDCIPAGRINDTALGRRPKERERGLGEVGRSIEKDGTMITVWHHPQCGSRDGAIDRYRHFDRVKRVAHFNYGRAGKACSSRLPTPKFRVYAPT